MPMQQHVSILGWLYIGFSVLGILMAVFVLLILVGAGALAEDADVLMVTSIVGVVAAVVIMLFSIPGIIAGIGLLKRKSWARLLAIILGILNLLSIPFGTLLGIYTLWVLLKDETVQLFEGTVQTQ